MSAHHDLIQEAAGGSTAAHLGLVDLAIAAGASGSCCQIEALITAEIWARLAAAAGGPEESRALVGVFLARIAFEDGRGNSYSSAWYEGEARRVLSTLREQGDPDAAQAFEEVSDDQPAQAEHPLLATHIFKAATGDLASLTALYDLAANAIIAGQTSPLEALVAGEIYARLGAASGDPDLLRRLSAILAARGRYERQQCNTDAAALAISEAAILMARLADLGDVSASQWLTVLAGAPVQPGVAVAATYLPNILNYMTVEGSC